MRKLAGLILALTIAAPAGAEDLGASAQAAISHYRAQHGLGAVTPDPRLMQLAAEQAHAMARAGVLEHNVDRPFQARVVSYSPDVAVENIAAGTTSFAATLEMWKHSPGHDANLRNAGVTRFGIAAVAAPQSKYKMFWSLIMAGRSPHGVRHARAPAIMAGAPAQGPKVRVRAARTEAHDSSLLSGLKKLLHPLW